MTARITDLYRAAKTAFAESDSFSTTSVVFGEREAARRINEADEGANRIVFVPVEGDAIGEVKPGQEGHIGVLWESCTILVWGRDPNDAEDEAAQYDATRTLFGMIYRALWNAAAGQIRFSKVSRVKAGERVFGTEWRLTISVRDDLTAVADETVTDLIPDPLIEFTLPVATG